MRGPSACAVVSLSCTLLLSAGAQAQSTGNEAAQFWNPAWSHAGPADYTLAAAGLSALLVETAFWQNKQTSPHWYSPILFDQAVRDATRGTSEQTRSDAATVSWVIWFAEIGYPMVVDVPYAWVKYGRDVAWDLFWQDAVTLSLSGAVDIAMRDMIGRVRPGNYECLAQGGTGCLNGPETTWSFPSGHFTETTTATALICTQHLTMHLYGSPADAITCASAIAADATVGWLRMVADDHWATDVVAGGALGALFGWGVPTLMHLHGVSRSTSPEARALVMPTPVLVSHGAGLGVTGIF